MNDFLRSVLYMTIGSLVGSFIGNMFFLLVKKMSLKPRPEYRCDKCGNWDCPHWNEKDVLFPCRDFKRRKLVYPK